MMRILGIDPGTNVLGFALLEVTGRDMVLLEHNVVRFSRSASHAEKLHQIFLCIVDLVKKYRPAVMAIEAPFHGKNVQSMLKLGRAQGVAILAAMYCSVPVEEYSPKKIKLSVTGNGNATKEQVSAMVYQLIQNKVEVGALDATDACATAICHYFQNGGPFCDNSAKVKDWSAFAKLNPDRIV